MGFSDNFLSLRYVRRLILHSVQFVHRWKTTFLVRQQTGEKPHAFTEVICPEAGPGTLAVTNHYIAFLKPDKKAAALFPLLGVTEWGVDTAGQVPAFWIEGVFEQDSGRHSWHTAGHKAIMETVTEQMEKGLVAKKRAAITQSQEKLDSYMTAVNTVLNQHSKVILLEGKAPLDDKADTLLQNAQVLLDTMWELFVSHKMPQLRDRHSEIAGVLRDQVQCYAALKGNRMAKIVLEARGYALPDEDIFIESDAFIDEYYRTALPPFEILEKVREDVLTLTGTLLPEAGLHPEPLRFLVSEAVQLGYRVTIANAMVIAKRPRRIRIA